MVDTMWAVYRQYKNGKLRFVPRTVTHSEKLAREIAADLSEGIVVRPDGSTRKIRPFPHIAKQVTFGGK